MKTQRGLILLLSEKTNNWVATQLHDFHEFVPYSELKEAVKTLQNIRYDLIMIDDNLFGDLIYEVVAEIKRQFQSIPVVVLSESKDIDYHNQLMRIGVDDLLTSETSQAELRYHVRLVLKQYDQYRTSIQRQQNLYTIAVMPRLLEGTNDLYAVITQSMKVIASIFHLQGVVMILQDGETFRLYAGNNDILSEQKLYTSDYQPSENDPFLWTIQNGIVQVYARITASHSYTEIPMIAEPRTAIILPLNYHGDALGSLGIFLAEDTPFTHEDLFIFEQFAVQLSSALKHMSQHQAQRRDILIHAQLLDTWKLFADVQFPQDVAHTLCQAAENFQQVHRALVWLSPNMLYGTEENLFDNHNGEIAKKIPTAVRGSLEKAPRDKALVHQLDGETKGEPVVKILMSLMEADNLNVFPIVLSSQIVGRLIVGTLGDQPIDISLIENIIQIAQTSLERVTLNNVILENHDQLLSILCSIAEGLFFIDRHDKVALCNPQLTELTSISASNVINRDSEVLLHALATRTQSPDQTYTQLQAAKEKILAADETEYPIVTVTLIEPKADLHIEFIKSFSGNTHAHGWIGVIHNDSWAKQDFVFDSLVEDMRLPYAHVQSLLATLMEQHGHFNYRQREQLIGQIGNSIEHMSRLWDDFHDLYKLRFGGITIGRERVKVDELINRIVGSRQFQKAYRQFNVEMAPNLPPAEIDEFSVERAISNVINRALAVSPPTAQINIRTGFAAREVQITVEDAGEAMPSDMVEQIFGTLSSLPKDSVTADLGLYVASELVRRNGGHVSAKTQPNKGTMITIAFPVTAPALDVPAPRDAADTAQPAHSIQSAPRTPERDLQTILLVEGKSKFTRALAQQLEKEKYELLIYQAPGEAVRDIKATRIDLIVIDLALSETNGLALCKSIRQLTEAPIILIADRATADEKVKGLNAGADEFLTYPITDDEMLARIRVIFSRKRLADRTSEPFIVNDLYIDFARRIVIVKDQPVELTRIEYDLLYTLVINRGQTLTHKQLLTQVWGPEYQDETQYLWVNISRLRKKLEPTQSSPRYIRTQSGIGYYFDAS